MIFPIVWRIVYLIERHVSEPYCPSEQIQWKHTVTYPSSTSESKTPLNQIYQKNTEDDRKECRAKLVGSICKKHGMAYHCYADDAQIYQVIKPLDNWDCLFDIKSWMCTNMLKLNQDKTELIVFAIQLRRSHHTLMHYHNPFGTLQ
jgi:hypothetical protein